MKRINIIKSILFAGTVVLGVSCTNLDEEVLDGVVIGGGATAPVNTASLLTKSYEGLRSFQDIGGMYALDEMSTDALVGPTRGGDWDDNAKWRQLHTHTWAPDHNEVKGAWNSLLSNVYNCNLVVENGTATEVTQARFLRAFYYYNVIDLFGQVPYREVGSSLEEDPKVWTRQEATAFVISELEAVVGSLPARTAGDASIANKDAAHFLLAKLYLNKGVFNAADPAGPYVFDAADMTKVVSHVDAISSSLAADYWDNFKPNNNTSPEILFSSKNLRGGAGGGIQSRWRAGMHYNQTPDGWNGFATVAEYYNKFDPNDKRIKNADPAIIAAFGNPVGFQIGQMYKPGGVTPLQDRNGNPLVYTAALTLITSGATLETAGVRGQKYIPDAANLGTPENDYELMRYSDALLMKAEAIARGGAGSIGTIMTDIAVRTGKPASPATLDGIYLERSKELWWEGWRRNDMIRFGKFLAARELKPYVSDNRYVLFPIPADALFNANLKQNPGY
ncbi:RagB/SusD family nutrient uptake outer membrane protein [Flavobacterium gawalongense]|uniref:RagB/SusD family nutrient uptake outer membrane protein n=1 Tax=Flavobacterium gawalongense TaxID=2594432 RepID=A0A553BXE2_9FLAO|nr:RagB/SusD family nutrient uptake outer membrane protein [Flavobacterium gawalongense]TRX04209.1 RagB/SusD family nutrient uptake outer membrane protein [Flavobacterium gawalongense]TRX09341.1 RagB/SusD family nutrient uptake outer membrane protein [Flavobacterium gawalongense]TRX12845.1 RagB/SusD family nutrient uptake outer membrane protein [Flavobacterium gawalongense]TRX13190.1 RagB/SusD family nutrient uptake outer membrane protein [Flavobacterium gawalongense]TRX30748.1 RagB/SusD famil